MQFGEQIRTGFDAFFSAFKFIFSKGLAWTFLVPIILNLILFFSLFTLVSSWAEDSRMWVLDYFELSAGNEGYTGFLSDLLGGFIAVLIKLLFFFLFLIYGGYIILILLSPFYAWLSGKVEELVTGTQSPFLLSEFLSDIARGILLAVRNILIETGWILLLFVFGFIPVLGWVAPILLFFISSYFYGFSFMDYTLERKRLSVSQSVRFARDHKWMVVSNGFIFSLLLAIPIIGSFLAGMVSLVSVVAGTMTSLRVLDTRGIKQYSFLN